MTKNQISPTHSISSAVIPHPRCRRLETQYRRIDELKASPIKLRKPAKKQIEYLVQAIRRFGCVLPILVDALGQVIVGHGILAAARLAALTEVPTYCLADLSAEEARTLRISINKIEMMSKFDDDVLSDELAFLTEHHFELSTFTGFSSAETEVILNVPVPKGDDVLPGLNPIVTSRLGDVWTFEGGHRLGCLNALEAESYDILLAGEPAGLALCDPPYNLRISSLSNRRDVREFPMASGEMSSDQFTLFLLTYLVHLKRNTRKGALLLQFIDWRHIGEMRAAGLSAELTLFNLVVWSKSNPGHGKLWRSAHELRFVWKRDDAPHVDRVELGANGRNRSNVWEYPGANVPARGEDRDGRAHMTPKNIAMIKDAILDVSLPGEIVLDTFVGSGTTLLAAHRAKRRGYGLELEPQYVDLAVRRMEARTKAPARHAETGQTFAEIAEERAGVPRLRTRSR